jgi:hypothetical protein
MFIKLDDIDLIKKKDDGGDVSEIRSVHDVRVAGRRHIVELRVPGARHNIFQDMGREPITISFEGRIVGKEAEGTVDLLEERFEKNEALPFETDLASLKNVSEVVIASMDIRFVGGVANAVDYSMTLREHRPESKGGKGEGKSKGKEGGGGEGAPGQKGGKEDAQKKMKDAKEESAKSSGGEGEAGTGGAADAKGSGSSPSKPSGDAEPASAGRGGGEGKDAAGSDVEGTPPPPPPEGGAAQSGGKEPSTAEGTSGMGGKQGVTEQEGRKE